MKAKKEEKNGIWSSFLSW